MRLATLTSGGDCPGLNAVIRGIVRTANNEFGSTVVGYLDGWVGLMEDRRQDLYDDAFIDSSAFETFDGDEGQELSEVGRVRSNFINDNRYAPY